MKDEVKEVKMIENSDDKNLEHKNLLNDANFCVISQFFEKFSDLCGLDKVDTEDLIKWLTNTDEGGFESAI